MQIRKYAAVAALSVAAIGVTAGTVHADPADGAASQTISYQVDVSDISATITTDGGRLADDNGVLKVKGDNGITAGAIPLSFRFDDFTFPITAQIAGNTVTLTPLFDTAHATYTPVSDEVKANLPDNATVKDIDLPFQDGAPWKTPFDREQAAWTRLVGTVSVGSIVGTALGGLAGAAIGCAAGGTSTLVASGALGAVAGSVVGAPAAATAGGLGGCLVGAAATGFIGTFVGQFLVTLPVALGAAIQYFTTISAPFAPAGGK